MGKEYLEFPTWKDMYSYVAKNGIDSVMVDEDSIDYINTQLEKIKVLPDWINREPFMLKLKRLQADYMGIDMDDHDFNAVFGDFWREIRRLNN